MSLVHRSAAGLAPVTTAIQTAQPAGDQAASDTDLLLRCVQVQHVTADVKTFVFEPADGRMLHHSPGQYLTVTVLVNGCPVERCYTISSPPSRPFTVTITVKQTPGGVVSNWLHRHLRPGEMVRARGPLGLFSMAHHPAAKYLFLSGGSGATPMLSMLRTVHDLGAGVDVLFVHSARTPDDIICRRELDAIAATSPNIRVVHICEHDGEAEQWGGYRGLLTLDMLRVIAPDVVEREVFICGPVPYMNAVRAMVAELGCRPMQCHEESFVLAPPRIDSAVHEQTASATDTFTIELARTGRTFVCGREARILDAAWDAGLSLASSCGQGMCGTCKSTMLAGSVDMQHAGGIRPREVASGKILICCSTPLEDIVLDA